MHNIFTKDEKGFTGLESAIVMIAVVVVAAVFSYVMLSAGFYTTQKSQEVVHSGITQASSSLALTGDVFVAGGTGANGNGVVNKITYYVTNTAGGTPVDLNKTIITYTDNDNFETFPYDATNGSWGYTPVIKSGSATNLVEEGDIYKIELIIDNSGFVHGVVVPAIYTITQADIDSGSVTNTAYATGIVNGAEVKSNTETVTITTVESPVLLITVFYSPTTYNAVGQKITYMYHVTNVGFMGIIGNITITDNKTGIVFIPNNNLAWGQSITTGTSTYTITQADIESGSVTNTAYAASIYNGNEVKSNTAISTVKTDQSDVLLFTMLPSPTTYSVVGQKITYSYDVSNYGTTDIIRNIKVTSNKTGTLNIKTKGLFPYLSGLPLPTNQLGVNEKVKIEAAIPVLTENTCN